MRAAALLAARRSSSLSSISSAASKRPDGSRRTAIVTGSTSGIGAGVADVLAASGFNVVINGIADRRDGDAAAERVAKNFGVAAIFHPADVTSLPQLTDLVDTSVKVLGGADVIVNNAGIQFVSSTQAFPDDKWNLILQINLTAAFHLTRAALPKMLAQRWGRVINIASVHGLVASVNKSAYVASKHGLIGFTKTVALETAGTGVTSNAICPGWVLTPLVQKQVDARAAQLGLSQDDARKSLLSEKQPSNQFVTPEQLGGLAAFLCSDAAAQITGVAIPMDGGWTSQ